jgi:uncharacterized protein
MSTGAVIRQARRSGGLTQAELAHRAGSSQAMVARYETEAASPTVRTLERLLRATGRELVLDSIPAQSDCEALPRLLPRVRALRDQILAATQAIGATNVRVFGSVARGDEHSGSDIDFLVDFPARTVGLMPLLRLGSDLESLLGRPVDIAAEELLQPDVRVRALAEALEL